LRLLEARVKAMPFPKLLEPEFFSSLRRGKPRLYTNRRFCASCEAAPFLLLPSLCSKSRAALVLRGLRAALAKAGPSLCSGWQWLRLATATTAAQVSAQKTGANLGHKKSHALRMTNFFITKVRGERLLWSRNLTLRLALRVGSRKPLDVGHPA